MRYTLVTTDVDGDRATLDFVVAIGTELTFGDLAGPTLTVRTTHPVNAVLPAAEGGDGRVTYSLDAAPALPANLGYVAPGATVTGGGAITGTPTTALARTTYTLTATDADGFTARFDFTITGTDAAPTFGSASVPAQRYTKDVAISTVNLPAATGGNGTLGYALGATPALPAGLRYYAPGATVSPGKAATGGGAIAGTPTGEQAATTYTLTAHDADTDRSARDAATLTFSLAVAGGRQPRFPTPQGAQSYVVGAPVSATLLAAGGGDPPLDYTLAPALPGGLSYTAPAAHGGTIAGTPGAVAPAATYRLIATNADGDAAQQTFALEVAADALPRFGRKSGSAQRYVVGSAVTATLPAATGGNGTLRYALTPTDSATGLPALPAGLTYYAPSTEVDARTTAAGGGTLAGTPTATDVDGDATTLTFSVQVTADLTPAFAVSAGPPQQYRRAGTVSATLPAATGGDTTPTQGLTYSVDPALPAGLTLGDTAPTITGTPAAEQAVATYTLAATDVDGDAATLPFTIAVAGNALPAFAAATGPATSFTVSTAGIATLSTATGGDGTLTYSIGATPALPGGLTYYAPGTALPDTSPPTNATRGGVIAGTPTDRASATTYTLIAADVDGDTATQTFILTVADTVPTFGSRASVSWPADARVQTALSVNLPAARGGNGTLTYTLSPAAADGPALHRAGRGGRARRYDCRDADRGGRVHHPYVDRHR